MSKIIFKYPLHRMERQSVLMPAGAEILTAQLQNGKITLWALVDEANEGQYRNILIKMTGEKLKEFDHFGLEDVRYISTVQDGLIVCHIFDDHSIF